MRDDDGEERGKIGALLDLLVAFASGVDLGVRLANLQHNEWIAHIRFVYPPREWFVGINQRLLQA